MGYTISLKGRGAAARESTGFLGHWPKRGGKFLAYVAVLALLNGATAGQSLAEDNARVKGKRFNVSHVNTIRVISSSGERWDSIAGGNVIFSVNAKIDLERRGYILNAGMFLGQCNSTVCGNHPLLASWWGGVDNEWSYKGQAVFDASKIPNTTSSGIAVVPFGDQIINACNQYLDRGPRVRRQFTWPYQLTLSANSRKRNVNEFISASGPRDDFAGGDVNAHKEVRFNVECVPYPSMEPDAEPVEVKLDVEPRGGNACPRKTTIKTRIVYHRPATAKFDIIRNAKVLKTVEIKARHVPISHGPDQWEINRQDVVEAKAGGNQFRIKVHGGGLSGMKVVNIECVPFEIYFSDLKYNVADVGQCPKKVWETATFTTSGPGKATYQIVRKNGKVVYEKELETILKNGQYKLVGQRVLNVGYDMERSFKAQIKGSSGIRSKWAKVKVSCPKRTNPGSGAKADKKSGAKAETAGQSTSAGSSAAPKRTNPIVCKGGKVKKGKCICPKNTKRKKVKASRFVCNPVKKKPARANPAVRTNPKMICKGGKIRKGKCKCGKNKKIKKVGANRYRCVAK
ncbi:hypothetical protein [Hoeflea prorocentri]|uniref:Uncharacterized protein n=1 Tax=Hoeflea prorocentri TaxID=1922333 RepID=A0A9X3UIQ7_9HYPH|nr:hypothetical protein [Hoeflea prorocentri]MCY6381578.1 hypothetical protein [Hoeflea prorocentri]MDA5399378.1 hypothetical protein [Hoeflea prorocentri]